MGSHNLKAKDALANDLGELCRLITVGQSHSSMDLERFSFVLRHNTRNLVGARMTLTPAEGEGHCELTRVRDDLVIVASHFSYRNPRFEFAPAGNRVQFDFNLSGDLRYRIRQLMREDSQHPSLEVWQRHHQGTYFRPKMEPTSHERRVTISICPEFLREHLLVDDVEVHHPLHAFIAGERGGSSDYQLPLTLPMVAIAATLIDRPLSGTVGLTYIEALAVELLCLAVANFRSLPARANEKYLPRDLRALSAAREALCNEQDAPGPALREIAASIGIGPKRLEHGFRTVYGESYSDFALRCRMYHARMLLRTPHWSVEEVSRRAGYPDPGSFACAFQRHFGVPATGVQ